MQQLPSGSWRATYCRVIDGKRHRETSTHRTKSEALDWLSEKRGTTPTTTGTLGEWLDIWLALYKSRVQPNTFRTNAGRVKKHIRPGLGHVKMKDLTPILVEHWLVKFQAELGPGEAFKCGQVLRTALYAAVKKGLISQSPFTGMRVTLPKQPEADTTALTREELARLIAAAGDEAWAYRLWVDLGCRPSEFFALTWADFDGTCISITKSLDRTTCKVKETKTKRSRRTLPISKSNADALQKVRAARTTLPTDLIFPAPGGGYWWSSNYSRNRWSKIVKKAGLASVSPYVLRHTCATLLLGAGVSIKTVSERLGHEDITTTLRTYVHLMPGDQEKAAEAIGEILANSTRVPHEANSTHRPK